MTSPQERDGSGSAFGESLLGTRSSRARPENRRTQVNSMFFDMCLNSMTMGMKALLTLAKAFLLQEDLVELASGKPSHGRVQTLAWDSVVGVVRCMVHHLGSDRGRSCLPGAKIVRQ